MGGEHDGVTREDVEALRRAASPQRAILVFVADSDAGDDLHALLSLPDARPLHPSPEGFGRGTQERWSDDECRDYAWNLLVRLAGRVEWGSSALVPPKGGGS